MPIIDATNDFFIRTSDPRHTEKVAEIMQRVYDNGWVTKGTYEGWYCPRCADFKTERELGPGQTCPIHEIPLEREREENWFFRLSAFQERLEGALRGAARLRRPRLPPQRGGRLHQAGPRGRLALAAEAEVGDAAALGPRRSGCTSGSTRCSTTYTALTFAREGEDLTDRYWPADLHVMAQGHPQVPRGDLARAAAGPPTSSRRGGWRSTATC